MIANPHCDLVRCLPRHREVVEIEERLHTSIADIPPSQCEETYHHRTSRDSPPNSYGQTAAAIAHPPTEAGRFSSVAPSRVGRVEDGSGIMRAHGSVPTRWWGRW